MSKHLRTPLSALAGAAALAVLGVAYAQSALQPEAPADLQAPPSTMIVETEAAAPVEAAPAAPMATPAAEPAVQAPVPLRVEIIAEPVFVAPPPGLMAPLDRAGVVSEFEAMRVADVLVPSGEAGDTLETAERRNAYHQGQADEWIAYQERLAEVRLANQRALEQQAALEQPAREAPLQASQPTDAAPTPAMN